MPSEAGHEASVLRGTPATQRGVTGHDCTVRADICMREGRTYPPRRSVYALHLVFLFRLSPKGDMNPSSERIYSIHTEIPDIEASGFYPELAEVSKGIEIAYISPSIGVTPGGVSPLLWEMVRRQYV